MKVEHISLKNFRNIHSTSFSPQPSINFVLGMNGQGKTSVLEALSLLATFRSFRDSKAQVLKWGESFGEISCVTSRHDSQSNWNAHLKLTFQSDSKIAYVNEKPFKSSTQYLTQRFGFYHFGFYTVIFNPVDHELVRGEPHERRSYLDLAIAAENLEYLSQLKKYKKILDQRNAILKTPEKGLQGVLGEFTAQLCQVGAWLTLKRLVWLRDANKKISPILRKTAPGQSPTHLSFHSSWISSQIDSKVNSKTGLNEKLSLDINTLYEIFFDRHDESLSLKRLEQALLKKTSTKAAEERKVGHTLVGPHRDDWAFSIGEHPLKGHGSQGEVRSVLLALKLAEIELFRDKTGHRPIFLLDDFSSELDDKRRKFLLDFLEQTDLQVFVTTTEQTSYVGKRYWISQGMVQEDTHDH